jgi:class 3 adenylate cyclase
MFCDLVGSTALASRLDAEDWRNLVSGYLDAASEAVAQMGGRVATKLGDGLMALFGHPIAQENDSERAGRAALRIQGALAELNRHNAGLGRPELVARIGIESGRWWWMRPEKSSAMRPIAPPGCRRSPIRERC